MGRGVTRCGTAKARMSGWKRSRPQIAVPDALDVPAVDFVVAPDGAALRIGRKWYVAAVEPGRDYRVAAELARVLGPRGVEAWLPECKVRKRQARRGVMVSAVEPLFPGYLLVRVDLALCGGPAAIEAADGVDCLLRRIGGALPYPLPGDAVAGLKRQIDQAGGVLLIEDGHWRWKKELEERKEICAAGAPVRVLGGPFTSFNGLYLETRGEDRVKILLDIFGRPTAIEIEEALVEPVADPA